MGTDFTAVVNHNLNFADIHTLPDLLNRNWQVLERFLPIVEGYPVPGSTPEKWQWRENEAGFSLDRLHTQGTVMIDGHEFHGIISERVLRICHGVRWVSFLTEQVVRDKLVRVCRHIASELGSKQIVYLPDGFLKPEGAIGVMYEGKAVEEMISWLLDNCGPPVENTDSIYRGSPETWNSNGYYVDRV